jgi:hypothetical protein
MPALDARAEGAQAPGLSRGSGEDATPTPAGVGWNYAFSARQLGSIVLVAAQLALTLLVIHRFHLESRTFFQVMVLASTVFVVARAAADAASAGVLRAALGGFRPPRARASRRLVRDLLGLALIGVCHLPVRMPVRVGLLVADRDGLRFLPRRRDDGALVAGDLVRAGLDVHVQDRRVPVRAALRGQAPTPAQAFAYFFMLPNVCFPLYPVVDYSTFVRVYYDRDALSIHETGVKWIVRGLVHLILYRFVYLLPGGDPAELADLGDLVQFLLATYLLYLRVSGQFHVIAGVLHLFGFRLPETHHLYYLASSFTDFWRRINIYWKDFMMKLVYYPSFFRLRRFGGNLALVAATAIVFLVTWVLHSYQWFWLRGGFPLAPQDAVFWAILGVLVVVGSLRDMKRPRKRRLGPAPAWSASLALRTVFTFSAICLLWSLWSAESLSEWLAMWLVAGTVGARDLWLIAGLLAGGLLIAGHEWSVREPEAGKPRSLLLHAALQSTAVLVGLLLLGHTELYARQGPRLAATVESLQRSTLNARDAALQHKGYYENLDNTSRMSANLWDVQAQKPRHWVGLIRDRSLPASRRLPGRRPASGREHPLLDQPLTVNRWGMRDRDTSLEKPPGTYRIALLGPSHVMGSGVADGETFADYLEERLNESAGAASPVRYEVLNFGVAGYSLLAQLAMLEDRVFAFQPDAVFITDSPRAAGPMIERLLAIVAQHVTIPYPGLEALLRESGVTALGGRRDPRAVRQPSRARAGHRYAGPHALERSRAPAAAAEGRSRGLDARGDRGRGAPPRRPPRLPRARQRGRSLARRQRDGEAGRARGLPGLRPLRALERPRPEEPAHQFGGQPPQRRRDEDHRRAAARADPGAPRRAADRMEPAPPRTAHKGGLAMSDDVGATVKDFILREFLPGENPAELTDSTPLITGGCSTRSRRSSWCCSSRSTSGSRSRRTRCLRSTSTRSRTSRGS